MEESKEKKKKRAMMGSNKYKGFSKGEKDLYKEVGNLNNRDDEFRRMVEERTAAYFLKKNYGSHMPVPSKKAENKELFG